MNLNDPEGEGDGSAKRWHPNVVRMHFFAAKDAALDAIARDVTRKDVERHVAAAILHERQAGRIADYPGEDGKADAFTSAWEANGHMISAAPELYEALNRILTPAMRETIAKRHAAGCPCNYCAANAAMDKAEGRALAEDGKSDETYLESLSPATGQRGASEVASKIEAVARGIAAEADKG